MASARCHTRRSLLAVGPITLQQYDIFPAALTLCGGGVSSRARRNIAVWTLLALGTMTKVYPALLVPVFLHAGRPRTLVPRVRRAAIDVLGDVR